MAGEDMELEVKFERIRSQGNSKLANQKHFALILSAVEENIKEQKNPNSPAAYFVSFLALLDQCIKGDEIIDKDLAASTAYFIDLVSPYVAGALLRAKFSDILVKLGPALSNSQAEAPLIRSCIGALETLLIAQDAKSWSSKLNVSPLRALNALLEMSLDGRPKIRKRAQEAVKNILSNPPASPNLGHVAGGLCSEYALKSIVKLLNTSEIKKLNKEINAQLIHNLLLIQTIANAGAWSSSQVEPLVDVLLEVSRTNDQYLVASAFSVFEGLFDSLSSSIYSGKFLNILNVLFDLKPSVNDGNLAGAWVAVLAKAIETYSKIDSLSCLAKIPDFFELLANYLASDISAVYISAANCAISIINDSIPNQYLLLPPGTAEFPIDQETYEKVDEVISQLSEVMAKLLSVKYSHCAKEVMEILVTLINKLRYRANPDLIQAFEIVGKWRTDEESSATLDLKAEEDAVIASTISNLGAEVVLSSLPLNLEHPSRTRPGRAWLLPLLRDNVRHSSLGYYVKSVLPLVEVYEKKVSSLGSESVHAKVFETVIDQIWSLLPHFCDLPNDLIETFNTELAEKLCGLIYSNLTLRTTICHALKMLAESNMVYSEGVLSEDVLLIQQFPVESAKENLQYLSEKMSSNILAVLFNVFSQSLSESSGYMLETIEAWLKIAPSHELEERFNAVCGVLKQALEQDSKKGKFDKNNSDNSKKVRLSITMMDLVVVMAKYVPASSYEALFTIFNLTNNIEDGLIQKRSYRIVSRLTETENGKAALLQYINEIETVFIKSTETALSGARASRLTAINKLIDILPNDHLYFIPSIASEIILATKNPNEKTRSLAYDITIQMGKKMSEGGVVENGKVPFLDSETPSVEASLNEYFTIISAGLAGDSPHMISATITTITCLIYEFLDSLDVEFLKEMSSTIELFLTSNNREIVKSTIGFVKVEVLSLPIELVQPNLKQLLEYLMRWSHEHHGHFKLKVKHIIERMVRRFGYEAVEANIPEEDIKLLVNIKKTKQRNKRKEAEQSEQQPAKTNGRFLSAYDEVMNDSDDSEEEASDDEPQQQGKKLNQYIIETSGKPLDLLDRQALAHISLSKPKKGQEKTRSLASKFKSKNGKFVFGEGQENEQDPLSKNDSSINAYLDAVKQGPIRGQRDRLKYKKGRTNIESDDDEPDEPKKKPTRFQGKGGRVSKNGAGRGKFGKGRR